MGKPGGKVAVPVSREDGVFLISLACAGRVEACLVGAELPEELIAGAPQTAAE